MHHPSGDACVGSACFREAAIPGPRELSTGHRGGGQTWGRACLFPPETLTHTLPALRGGLEASLTQTVEGALGVDTVPSQTPVCECTLVHIYNRDICQPTQP